MDNNIIRKYLNITCRAAIDPRYYTVGQRVSVHRTSPQKPPTARSETHAEKQSRGININLETRASYRQPTSTMIVVTLGEVKLVPSTGEP